MDREIQNFINGVNRKDAKAWERIYMDYYSPLCHYAMKILNNREQAEDLVQGAIIKLWESPLGFENIAAFNVYLYRTVNNNCLKEIRDKEREDKRLKEWAFFTDEIESESLSAVMFEEVIRKLRKVIEDMPSKRREVILLSMKRMTNDEISLKLNISQNTVKKHKKEAYAVIKAAVKSDLFIFSIFF
ncbi:sigma-70 family RNA polymerase sigma factor [Butyricimonas sp.]|uniref:sigma-70 family RNA polymerase sigma factor n=1 Tax=Butyricimonas sp. TaxID=1969738 RepID=UPI001B1159E3|nr:sigma-70 family RNA polymerase sigma factor [Butyricimonas sp.]MBO4959482.1 sigma-70 family RNA polymerase sigma factor [Butyricimonas sp.]